MQSVASCVDDFNISEWPDFVLLQVFAFLPLKSLSACGLTCTNWHRVAADPTLWPLRMEFDRFTNMNDVDALLKVGGGNLEFISLRLVMDINGMFEMIASGCPNLHALELDHCPSPSEMNLSALSRISGGCKNLRCFALRNMTLDEESMSAFTVVAKEFEFLSHVVLFKCFGISPSAIIRLVSDLDHLTHLDIEHLELDVRSLETVASRIGRTIKAFYFSVPVASDLHVLRWLENLEALGIHVFAGDSHTEDDFGIHIQRFRSLRVLRFTNLFAPVQVRDLLTAQLFPKLEHLSMFNCAPLSQPHLSGIVRCHKNLRHLCLDFRLSDSVVEVLADVCKQLTFLYFKFSASASCRSLQLLDAKNLPKLGYLYVDDSKNIPTEFLSQLVEQRPDVRIICYGRTFFHYPKDQPILKRMMNEILLFNPYLDLISVK
ncbi:unnamed protein product [Notodromas monacha]|uniref:F-box domain-containing protein n=1 Tax=Notodromas monacha TaxID=399045 RepID=A0A7R9BRH0_9CRUS|nr:unnamed protein product [Notodromas monacha]CAG0918823.1 unnamed protein product [Notodromas monacha]